MTGHSHSFEKWTTEPQEGPSSVGVFYDCPDGYGPCLHDVVTEDRPLEELIKQAKYWSSVVWHCPVWKVSTVKGTVGNWSSVPFEYLNSPSVEWPVKSEPDTILEGSIMIPHGSKV